MICISALDSHKLLNHTQGLATVTELTLQCLHVGWEDDMHSETRAVKLIMDSWLLILVEFLTSQQKVKSLI